MRYKDWTVGREDVVCLGGALHLHHHPASSYGRFVDCLWRQVCAPRKGTDEDSQGYNASWVLFSCTFAQYLAEDEGECQSNPICRHSKIDEVVVIGVDEGAHYPPDQQGKWQDNDQ